MTDTYDYKTLQRKARQAIIIRDGWKCRTCGSKQNLEVHHIFPYAERGDDSPKNLVTLCCKCHDIFEGFGDYLLSVLAGNMTLADFQAMRPILKREYRNKMGAPSKYGPGVELHNIKVPLTDAELERVKRTASPRQRAAVLLKLCDDIDAVVNPKG